MAKKKETIEIPMDLARLLVAEPEDFKDSSKYDESQKVSKALLDVLINTSGGK